MLFHQSIKKAEYCPGVYAHRGGALLWPGNTILAFDEALKLGADVLEMDVRSTKDGILILLHNPTVDETTDGSGAVADWKWEDLQRLDAGYRWGPVEFPYRGKGVVIPALEEVFERYRDRDVKMNLEIKQITPSIVDRFCDLVRRYDMGNRVLIASFSTSVLRKVRARLLGVATSASTWEASVFYLLHWLNLTDRYHLPVRALQFWSNVGPFPIITKSLVIAVHRYGLEIHGWTVNSPKEMKRLIGLEVDALITDHPQLLIEQITDTRFRSTVTRNFAP